MPTLEYIPMNKIFNLSLLSKLLIIDLGVVLLHILFAPEFSVFDLDMESNVPTVYQGLKLIIIGTIILGVKEWKNLTRLQKLSVGFTSGFLIFLGADEMALIHENIPVFTQQIIPALHTFIVNLAENIGYTGSVWVIYALPIIGFLCIAWVAQIIWFVKYQQKDIRLLILGIFIIMMVPVIEWINTSSGFSPETYRYWIVLEEMVELIGVTLIATEYLKLHKKSLLLYEVR